MKEKDFLYHGSSEKIKGSTLNPSKANDWSEKKGNNRRGVYATHLKKLAIIMAILKTIPSHTGLTIDNGEERGIIYGDEKPKKEEAYLYYLLKGQFNNFPKKSWQWISYGKVKPIKMEKIKVKNYLHLIRKATSKEMERYKKYEDKNMGLKK